MKKILLISTGGTISMKVDKTGLASPKAGAKELTNDIRISEDIRVIDLEFKKIPSAHFTIKDIMELKEIIEKEQYNYDGIVITHGTDTMEETAYFLDLILKLRVPIIITGSQRNLSAISSDTQINIVDSILVASDERAAEMGVLIVFGSEVHLAREVTKAHRTKLDTFKSMEFGPIATVDNSRVIWFRKPIILDYYKIGDINKVVVDIITCYLGADSRNIRNSIQDNVNGIVLQALGAGHVPEAVLNGVNEAIKYSIPVVLSSRPYMGRFLTDTYGFVGAEKYLRSIGVIFGGDLSSQKVRLKLMILLSNGLNHHQIKEEFEKDFY